MPRNQEVIRQWKVLHALEIVAARRDDRRARRRPRRHDAHDPPRSRRAAGSGLSALRRADDDGRVRWRLDGQVLKGLETGFTLAELCALYLSRNLLESVAGTPFQRDLTHGVRAAREDAVAADAAVPRSPAGGAGRQARPARAAAATTSGRHRGAAARSARCTTASRRCAITRCRAARDEGLRRSIPYRLAFAQGGLYLLAYVPEYKDVRTFAVDRIASVSLEKQTFTPHAGSGRRRVRQLARRQHRADGAGRDRVRRARRAVRPRPRLAPVAADQARPTTAALVPVDETSATTGRCAAGS